MGMITLLRWIKGYKKFVCSEGFSERLLNLCTQRNVNVWNIKNEDRVLSGFVSVKQASTLMSLSENSKTKVEFEFEKGLPLFLKNNRNRVGFVCGLLLMLILLKVFSCFIWSIEIVGLNNLSYANVLLQLKEIGIDEGLYKGSVDQSTLKQQIMSKIPEIAWVSLNIHGCVLSVEISERESKPYIVPQDVPCNVKARFSGQITKVGTKAGSCECKVGDAVIEGEVIISGIVENKYGGVTITHADGAIYADTTHKIEIKYPMSFSYNKPNKETKTRILIDFMGARATYLPCEGFCSDYYSTYKNKAITVFDRIIPVRIKEEHMRSFTKTNASLSKKNAQKNAISLLQLEKLFKLSDKKIKDCTIKSTVKNNTLILSATYSCNENICYKEKINLAEDVKLYSDSDNTDNEQTSNTE